MECLADRFLLDDKRWIDAATGAPVRLYFETASPLDAFDWDEQCGRLFNARHPLLNSLIDYGPAPDGRRFEAYECHGAMVTPAIAGERLMLHLVAFLTAAGITLPAARSRYAVRPVVAGVAPAIRPLAVTLQPRRALDAARETLETPTAAPSIINLVGPPFTGLRTARTLVARTARLLGFVPVCSMLLARKPEVGDGLRDRHLCVFAEEDVVSREALATILVRLASASARRHVIVRLTRTRAQRRAIVLDPLSIRALIGMVFVEPDHGPAEQELFDAARVAEGRPGAFLTYLSAAATTTADGAMVVHETPQEYSVEVRIGTPSPTPAPGRAVSAALRANARAHALAARGRHAAARRALERGARVLAGRGRPCEAADCLVNAGHLSLDRGRCGDAADCFTQAQRLAPSGPVAWRAAAGLGEAWIDDLRLIEAEAVLRGALTAAETVGDSTGLLVALAGLVRSLLHQDRASDAVATAAAVDWRDDDRPGSVPLLAALSRSHVAIGRTASAIRLARRAQELARASGTPRALATADLAFAEAIGAAGDASGMQEQLAGVIATARGAHLPMIALDAELAGYESAASTLDAGEGDRARRRLRAIARLPLPRRLRQQVASMASSLEEPATIREAPAYAPQVHVHREAADALELLLQVCQQAADDPSAIAAACAAVLRRLGAASVVALAAADRRLLVCEGRPWVAHSTVVAQALAVGMPAASDAGVEPREAADAVRYGGEIIGVVACRWTAGATVDGLGSAAVLHAAALALAAPMRAVLDRGMPLPPATAWGDLLGDSPAATTLRDAVVRAARAPFSVLIEGESGCGKELVARALHRLGPRRDRKFCPLNCAALTDELVEAELFGHARGAFTGAATERAGLFEEADGGTLFLDEVGELSARAQAKLLRVLQEGEVRRVGETFSRRVDTRVVAATNRELEAEVAAGRFRADLRFRLDVVRIPVPPLRNRPGDIPMLATHFWSSASKSVGSQATLTPGTLAALARYDWPGNVRELQNVIAWIAVHSPRRGRIGPSSLPAHVARSATPAACTFEAAREEFERRFIRAALATANGQRAKAAAALGVTRQGLAKMLRRLRIE